MGGRRTKLGRTYQGQVLDLRRYLVKIPKSDLQRICAANPEYFFQTLPYALALGVHKRFAKQFGMTKRDCCSWLSTTTEEKRTALQWALYLEQVVDAMSDRNRKLPFEKFLALIQSFRR